jgi:hypothetical protein
MLCNNENVSELKALLVKASSLAWQRSREKAGEAAGETVEAAVETAKAGATAAQELATAAVQVAVDFVKGFVNEVSR